MRTLHPYLDAEYPIRLAHRGSRILWPENTLRAFDGAFRMGYRYIETDVRASKEGVPVVIHDAMVDRTTDGTGAVADMTVAELKQLDAGFRHDDARGQGVTIPTLEEVLTRYPDVRFNIDMKSDDVVAPLADLIRRMGRELTTLVGSFSGRRLRRFRKLTGGDVATSAGPGEAIALWTAARLGRTVRGAPVAYQLPAEVPGAAIDARLIEAAHRAGAHVHVWTVNDPDDMERLLDLGVDGIVTDRVDLLDEVLRRRATA